MVLIDIILNLAALLLWLNLRSVRFEASIRNPAAWLAGLMSRTQTGRLKRWYILTALLGLLTLRALFYWQVGPAIHWTPRLRLGAIILNFRSDALNQTLLFSAASFLITLGIFYLCVLFLSVVNGDAAESDPFQKLIRAQLGFFQALPWPAKTLLPLAACVGIWWIAAPLLSNCQIIPPPKSTAHRIEQSIVLGLGAYLPLKFLIAAFLCLYLLNSYVYFGDQPFWAFINLTGRRILAPLRPMPLRLGKLDFAPLIAIAIVFLLASLAARELVALYSRLPL
jgi:uncharacterized protein YggT (Ycf19 family)